MANAFAAYPESGSRKLATDRRTRGADDVDLQQITLYDGTAEYAAAVDSSGRQAVLATISGTVTVDTEFPGAVALSDALGNPTSPLVGGANLIWDSGGTQWTRWAKAAGANTGIPGVAGDSLIVTGTGAASNATPIAATDVVAYRWVSVQLTGNATANATALFECSNDNTNWLACFLHQAGATPAQASSVVVGNNANVLFHGALAARYFRVRLNPYTAGTVTGTANFTAVPGAPGLGNAMAGYAPLSGMSPSSAGLPATAAFVAYDYSAGLFKAPAMATSDTSGVGFTLMAAMGLYDGTNINRARTIGSASATTGAGLLGVGLLAYDGTNYRGLYTASNVSDATTGVNLFAAGTAVFDGTNWHRWRTANNATGTTGTGVPAAGCMVFDGTNYRRLAGDTKGNLTAVGYQDATSTNTASWTSATAAPANLIAAVTNYGSASIELNVPGTITAGRITFWASADGGTNYYAVDAVRLLGSQVDSGYDVTGGSQLWNISADGLTHVRVQLTTALTGTGTVTARITGTGHPIEPEVAAVPAPGKVATYVAAMNSATGVVTASTTTYLHTIFHPSTMNRDVQITRIEAIVRTASTGGNAAALNDMYRLAFISAENGTPGGTAVTPQPTNRAQPASAILARRLPAAPTVTGTPLWQCEQNALTVTGQPVTIYNYDRMSGEEPITLRAGQAEGLAFYQITGGTALGTAPVIALNIYYRELV